ncbi:MAG TPA: sulfur carrier protein ThiS [Bryobacteraceae bacterium]
MKALSIQVNGEPRSVAEGLTIIGLLDELGVRHDRVAVEMNRAIVKQSLWADTLLPAGAQLEIVQFVGGG